MCPKVNARRVCHICHMDKFHLPHGQLSGYLSHAAGNQLVGVKRRSRTPGCKLLCSTCCSAGKEQFANREAVGDGSRRCVVALKGAHQVEKSAPYFTTTSIHDLCSPKVWVRWWGSGVVV